MTLDLSKDVQYLGELNITGEDKARRLAGDVRTTVNRLAWQKAEPGQRPEVSPVEGENPSFTVSQGNRQLSVTFDRAGGVTVTESVSTSLGQKTLAEDITAVVQSWLVRNQL